VLHGQARGRIAPAQLRIPAGALGLTGSDQRPRHSSIHAASHHPRAGPAVGPLHRLAGASQGHPVLGPPDRSQQFGRRLVCL
jgi:hypothetical protein